MTDSIRNLMHTKQNGDSPKLRIFSFIQQWQRIQPNFMNDSIGTFIHTKQHNTRTTRTTKTTTSAWVSLVIQSLCSHNWHNASFAVSIFKLHKNLPDFAYFIHHKFCTLHLSPKICTHLAEQFVHFIHPYMNPLPMMYFSVIQTSHLLVPHLYAKA